MEAACMNIFSPDDNLDKCDSIDNGKCFMILGGWFDWLWMQLISLFGLWKGLHEPSERFM